MNVLYRRQFTGLVYIICAGQPNSDRVLLGPWNRIPQSPQSSEESLQVFWRVHVGVRKLGSYISEGWWEQSQKRGGRTLQQGKTGKRQQIFPHISSCLGSCWEMLSTPEVGRRGQDSYPQLMLTKNILFGTA